MAKNDRNTANSGDPQELLRLKEFESRRQSEEASFCDAFPLDDEGDSLPEEGDFWIEPD